MKTKWKKVTTGLLDREHYTELTRFMLFGERKVPDIKIITPRVYIAPSMENNG